MNWLFKAFSEFTSIIYPNNCLLCLSSLLKNENCICTICEAKLPYTNYHVIKDNPVEKKLWGRVKLESAASLLFFEKGLDVQHLISNLKYKNRQDIGEKLAEIYGKKLLESTSPLLQIELIIPIPLHPKKYKQRGYNQCHTFALSLGQKLKKIVNISSANRKINTISQTGKNRINRWENVSDIFEISNQKELINKHILIVDDVITTGATIEALANQLLKIPGTKVSVLVMASAI